MTSPKLWGIFYQHSSSVPFLSTAISSIALAGFINLPKKIFIKLFKDKVLSTMVVLMALAIIGIFITQIRLAVGYGSINFRYMLAVLLPISLFMSYGLLEFKNMRGQLVSFAAITMGALTILPVATSTTVLELVPKVGEAGNRISKIFAATDSNGLPIVLPILLFVFFAIGSTLLVLSLFNLTNRKN
jgi:hypothetical protein